MRVVLIYNNLAWNGHFVCRLADKKPGREKTRSAQQLTQALFVEYAIQAALFLVQNAEPGKVCEQGGDGLA